MAKPKITQLVVHVLPTNRATSTTTHIRDTSQMSSRDTTSLLAGYKDNSGVYRIRVDRADGSSETITKGKRTWSTR